MPRFVILEHDHPSLHWDFMLEEGGALQTWRLPAPPGTALTVLAAERIGDHRLAYLDYEGPVSGGRGSVKRWDTGTFELLCPAADPRVLRLTGARWYGNVTISVRDGCCQFTFEPG